MNRDLFGNPLPDDFSRSLPASRGVMADKTKRENLCKPMPAPRVAPETPYCPVASMSRFDIIKSGHRLTVGETVWADGAKGTFRKSASAPGGNSAPGRDAMLGNGEPCRPVHGLAHIWVSDYLKK